MEVPPSEEDPRLNQVLQQLYSSSMKKKRARAGEMVKQEGVVGSTTASREASTSLGKGCANGVGRDLSKLTVVSQAASRPPPLVCSSPHTVDHKPPTILLFNSPTPASRRSCPTADSDEASEEGSSNSSSSSSMISELESATDSDWTREHCSPEKSPAERQLRQENAKAAARFLGVPTKIVSKTPRGGGTGVCAPVPPSPAGSTFSVATVVNLLSSPLVAAGGACRAHEKQQERTPRGGAMFSPRSPARRGSGTGNGALQRLAPLSPPLAGLDYDVVLEEEEGELDEGEEGWRRHKEEEQQQQAEYLLKAGVARPSGQRLAAASSGGDAGDSSATTVTVASASPRRHSANPSPPRAPQYWAPWHSSVDVRAEEPQHEHEKQHTAGEQETLEPVGEGGQEEPSRDAEVPPSSQEKSYGLTVTIVDDTSDVGGLGTAGEEEKAEEATGEAAAGETSPGTALWQFLIGLGSPDEVVPPPPEPEPKALGSPQPLVVCGEDLGEDELLLLSEQAEEDFEDQGVVSGAVTGGVCGAGGFLAGVMNPIVEGRAEDDSEQFSEQSSEQSSSPRPSQVKQQQKLGGGETAASVRQSDGGAGGDGDERHSYDPQVDDSEEDDEDVWVWSPDDVEMCSEFTGSVSNYEARSGLGSGPGSSSSTMRGVGGPWDAATGGPWETGRPWDAVEDDDASGGNSALAMRKGGSSRSRSSRRRMRLSTSSARRRSSVGSVVAGKVTISAAAADAVDVDGSSSPEVTRRVSICGDEESMPLQLQDGCPPSPDVAAALHSLAGERGESLSKHPAAVEADTDSEVGLCGDKSRPLVERKDDSNAAAATPFDTGESSDAVAVGIEEGAAVVEDLSSGSGSDRNSEGVDCGGGVLGVVLEEEEDGEESRRSSAGATGCGCVEGGEDGAIAEALRSSLEENMEEGEDGAIAETARSSLEEMEMEKGKDGTFTETRRSSLEEKEEMDEGEDEAIAKTLRSSLEEMEKEKGGGVEGRSHHYAVTFATTAASSIKGDARDSIGSSSSSSSSEEEEDVFAKFDAVEEPPPLLPAHGAILDEEGGKDDVWADFGYGEGFDDSDAESEYSPQEALEVLRRVAVRYSSAAEAGFGQHRHHYRRGGGGDAGDGDDGGRGGRGTTGSACSIISISSSRRNMSATLSTQPGEDGFGGEIIHRQQREQLLDLEMADGKKAIGSGNMSSVSSSNRAFFDEVASVAERVWSTPAITTMTTVCRDSVAGVDVDKSSVCRDSAAEVVEAFFITTTTTTTTHHDEDDDGFGIRAHDGGGACRDSAGAVDEGILPLPLSEDVGKNTAAASPTTKLASDDGAAGASAVPVERSFSRARACVVGVKGSEHDKNEGDASSCSPSPSSSGALAIAAKAAAREGGRGSLASFAGSSWSNGSIGAGNAQATIRMERTFKKACGVLGIDMNHFFDTVLECSLGDYLQLDESSVLDAAVATVAAATTPTPTPTTSDYDLCGGDLLSMNNYASLKVVAAPAVTAAATTPTPTPTTSDFDSCRGDLLSMNNSVSQSDVAAPAVTAAVGNTDINITRSPVTTVAATAVEPEASAVSRPADSSSTGSMPVAAAAAASTAEPAESLRRKTGEGESISGDHKNKELEGRLSAKAGGVVVETEEEASAATPGRSRESRKSGGNLGLRRTGSGIFRHLVERVQTPVRTRRRRRVAAAAAAAAAASADAAAVADADANANRADHPPAAGSEKGTTTTVATVLEQEEFDEDEVAEVLARAEAGDKEGEAMVVSRGIVMENAEISGRDDVLRVEGRLQGKMDVRRLEVEVGATVKGNVTVETACVKGTFDGTMECKKFLIVRKGARFCGEVSYRHLRVEPGASLEARMHHVCPTTTAAPPAATVTMPTAEEVASPPTGGDGGDVESDAPPAPASALTAGPAAGPATGESEDREEATGESEDREEATGESEDREEATGESEDREEATGESEDREEAIGESEDREEAIGESEDREEATGESEDREEATGESKADEAPDPMTLGAAGNTPPAATTAAADAVSAVPPSTLPTATRGKSAGDAAAVAPPSPAAVAATASIVNQQKLYQHQQMPWMPRVPTTTAAEVPAAWGVMMAAMAAGGMLPSEEQKQEEAAAGAVGKKQRPWTWSAVRAARARARAAEAEAGGGASLVGGPMAARARRMAAAATAAAITCASHSKSTAAAGVDSNDAPAGGELHQEDHEKEGEATTAPGGSARSRRAWTSKEATTTIPTEIAASPRPVGLLRKRGAASNPSPTSTKEVEEKSDPAVEVDPAVLAALPPVPAALDAAVAAMEAAKNRCIEDAAGIPAAGEGVIMMEAGEGISSSGSTMVAPVVMEVEASADSGGGVGKGVAASAVGLSEISAAADSPGAASSTTSNNIIKNNSDSRRFCWNTPPPTCRLPASEKAALVEEGKRALLAVRKEKHERERMMALASAVTTLQATERDDCEKSEMSLPSSPMTTPARSQDQFQARSPNRPRPRSPDRPKPRSPDRSQPRSPDRFQPHSPGRFQPRSLDRSQSRTPMWVSPWSPARSPGRSPGRPRRNLTRVLSSQQAASDIKEGGKKTTKTVEKPPPLTLHEKAAAAAVPWAAVGADVGGGNKARPVSKLSEAKAFLLGLVSAAPHQAPQQQQQPQDSSEAIGDGIGDDSTDPSGVGHADNDGNNASGRGRSRGRSKTRDGEVFEASVGGGGMLHLIRGRWARDKGRGSRRARSLDKSTKASRKRKGGIVADEPCDPASSVMVTLSGTCCPRPGDIGKNEEENERLVVSVPSEEEGGSEGGGVGEGGGSACVASSPVCALVRAPLVRQGRFRRSTSMPDSVSALARTGADADAGGGFETGDGGKVRPGGDGVKASPGEARPKSDEHGGFADSKACSTALGGVTEAGGGRVVATTRRARGWRRMVTGPED